MAAGSSSRMNGIKQLLPWKKSNLLLHAVETLQQVQKEHTYVVLGANYDTILKQSNIDSFPVALIQNTNWKKGLGNSIACGIAHILEQKVAYDGILVCLADQPLLDSNYYKELIGLFKLGKQAVVATKYAKNVGVPAIFDKVRSRELLTLNADSGAKQLLIRYATDTNMLNPGNKISDIDTPVEYQKLYRQHNENNN